MREQLRGTSARSRPAVRRPIARRKRPSEGVPIGFGITLDSGTRELADGLLVGGVPLRVLRLNRAGRKAWAELRAGSVRTAAGGALARRLTDAGLAHPVPPAAPTVPIALSVTIVVPVLERAIDLERCLSALGGRHPVVVVDDGSEDQAGLAAVAARHGARLVRRQLTGGPAAARNRGLIGVETDLVAFLDSDTVPAPGWVEALAAHLADPLVAAAAPRIVAAPARGAIAAYTRVRGALDLGPRPARVAPGGSVSYVPTAALVVRRSALLDAARDGMIFDPGLRFGEDVDLTWRLHERGWRVRYDPAVTVPHREPNAWRTLLARRFAYGTSAGPLATRHPGALAPLIVEPWSAAVLAALLTRRPRMAAFAFAVAVLAERQVRDATGVEDGAAAAVLGRVAKTARASGTYATAFFAPVLVAGLALPRTRAAALALTLAPVAADWWAARPRPSRPHVYAAAHIAEDVAYGAGVLAGSVHSRTAAPLIPVRSRRSAG